MPDVATEMQYLRGKEVISRTVHKFLPVGWDETPDTVHEALVVGKALLLEDRERWVKGTVFRNLHPEVDWDTPYCNNWGVCAMGALAVSILGMFKSDERGNFMGWQLNQYVPDNHTADRLYEAAAKELHRATQELYKRNAVYQLNDHCDCTFDMVINVFNRALANTSHLQDDNEEVPA